IVVGNFFDIGLTQVARWQFDVRTKLHVMDKFLLGAPVFLFQSEQLRGAVFGIAGRRITGAWGVFTAIHPGSQDLIGGNFCAQTVLFIDGAITVKLVAETFGLSINASFKQFGVRFASAGIQGRDDGVQNAFKLCIDDQRERIGFVGVDFFFDRFIFHLLGEVFFL